MNDFKNLAIGALAVVNVFITGYFGIFTPLLYLVVGLMVMDLITRCYAEGRKEKINKETGEDNNKGGIKSKKVWEGIYRKLGMVMLIILTLMLDFGLVQLSQGLGISIATKVIFTALTLAWIFVRETISNLENLLDAGIDLPDFIVKALSIAKDKVDSAGDTIVGGSNNEDFTDRN